MKNKLYFAIMVFYGIMLMWSNADKVVIGALMLLISACYLILDLSERG